ncbi:facilitated trehalose transporter Tret1 [Halyomorpha halys]|uniref:facilitated trehalose transporter Tret1 n=1 Tax=Halyomorpha halys TaxID=286706 RepID=UPI0006D4CEDD|nr:facilitated trehalose transporter Tret1 [Halyomorpha halys]
MKLVSGAVLVQYGFATIVNLWSVIVGAWLVWPSSANVALLSGEIFPNVTTSEIATMVSLMDLGNILTPIPVSYLINMVGRKMVINVSALIFIAASLLVIFSTGMWYIYIARLLVGMGKGIAFTVIPVYLTEIAQLHLRGTMGSLFLTAGSLGTCYGYIIGASLSYEGINIANLVFAVLLLTVGWLLPETPFYLLMKGKDKEAEKSLSIVRYTHRGSATIKAEMEQVAAAIESCKNDKARFIDIASSRSRRRALVIVIATAFTVRLSGISPLMAYGLSILPPTGGGLRPEIYMVIFAVILTVVNYIGAVLSDICGRKILLLYSAIGACIVDFTFALYFTLITTGIDTSASTWLPYVCLLFYGLTWSVGLGVIHPFLASELFPTNVKSYASSISTIILGLSSFGINKMFGEVYRKNGGIEAMFYFFGSCSFLYCIFCIYFMIETKRKTFQEIQVFLKHVSGEDQSDLNK